MVKNPSKCVSFGAHAFSATSLSKASCNLGSKECVEQSFSNNQSNTLHTSFAIVASEPKSNSVEPMHYPQGPQDSNSSYTDLQPKYPIDLVCGNMHAISRSIGLDCTTQWHLLQAPHCWAPLSSFLATKLESGKTHPRLQEVGIFLDWQRKGRYVIGIDYRYCICVWS